MDRPAFLFRSVSQQDISSSKAPSQIRPTISHSQTFNSFPEALTKRTKSRPSISLFASIFATFAPASYTNTSTSASGAPSLNLKRGTEVELRKDYLSPEREKEIEEVWSAFKRQSLDVQEDKLTSFPCIMEYEYDDQEEDCWTT
jgi:hypothetical protein